MEIAVEEVANFPLTSLPNEVLAIVFSHLEVKERLKACLVCKDWLQLTDCKFLLSDIEVCIKNVQSIILFKSMTRKFINFCFRHVLVDDNCCQLFKCFAPYIESIVIDDCEMNRIKPITLDGVLFDNLKELSVKRCDLWCIFPPLPNVSKLLLLGEDVISDSGLSILQRSMKNLKILRMSTKVVCDSKVYRRFYPQGLTYETNPSSAILSISAIKSFISERVSTLSELSMWFINASAMRDLSSIKYLNLRKFTGIFMLKCEDSLINFFKTQQNLKILEMDKFNLDDNTIDALLTYLPNIEELKLCNCLITDRSLNNVCQLNQLKKLVIKKMVTNKPEAWGETITNIKSKHIKYLDLECVGILRYLLTSFKELTDLTYLALPFCSLTDSCLHTISTHLVKLTSLNVTTNNNISDYGITGFSEKNQDPTSSQERVVPKPLYNLKSLRNLNLSFCNITENGLIAAIKFPFLHSLSSRGCNISKNTASILFSQNPNLKNFWNSGLSDP